ncbi:MAG: heterotetrameric sarcosine oxidase gamma subunit [Hyphomicrobiaceae bacterium]
MTELILKSQLPLDGRSLNYPGITIEEITDQSLVSIAVPIDGAAELNAALQSAYGTERPAVGKCTNGSMDNAIFLGLSQDQFFIMFDDAKLNDKGGDPAALIRDSIGHAAYVVDQSDGWVMTRVSGDSCRAALERICPIDLHPAMFSTGNVARTVMEHLATIIVCQAPDTYILLSPRSSANSFLHALDTSAKNVA